MKLSNHWPSGSREEEFWNLETIFWHFGGHIWWHNHIQTLHQSKILINTLKSIHYYYFLSNIKFHPTDNIHFWPQDNHFYNFKNHCTSITTTAFHQNHEDFLWISIFRLRPSHIHDLYFNKWTHVCNCEVWLPLAKRIVQRRILKSLIKEQLFDPLAAILDYMIIRITKTHRADHLVNTNLIYDMTKFGNKINFHPYLTHLAMPIFDHGVAIVTTLKDHCISIIPTKFQQNPPGGSWEDVWRFCAIFRWRSSWMILDFSAITPKEHTCIIVDHWPIGSWKQDVWNLS